LTMNMAVTSHPMVHCKSGFYDAKAQPSQRKAAMRKSVRLTD
jgi:hypothetical protein